METFIEFFSLRNPNVRYVLTGTILLGLSAGAGYQASLTLITTAEVGMGVNLHLAAHLLEALTAQQPHHDVGLLAGRPPRLASGSLVFGHLRPPCCHWTTSWARFSEP
jgi:hypothetical protein